MNGKSNEPYSLLFVVYCVLCVVCVCIIRVLIMMYINIDCIGWL